MVFLAAEANDEQELDQGGRSVDRVFLAKGTSVLPNHAHFLATQTCVFDRKRQRKHMVDRLNPQPV